MKHKELARTSDKLQYVIMVEDVTELDLLRRFLVAMKSEDAM